MPASVEASGLQAIDIMMPKKRQQGFAPGASSLGPSAAMTSHPGSQPVQSAAPSANANNFFGPFGSNGLPSSFIDTDILLNDDLWNQFSPAPNTGNHASNMAQNHHQTSANNASAATDVPSEQAFGESYVNIPYTSSLDMFGLQSRTFGTVQPTHEALHRLGKDTPSMDECDSPDGSNGETTSTIATSVLTPSSLGTTVGSLPQTSGSRHHRSTSNASSTNRSKTARSLSRSRTRVAASAERRAAERSPSTERGGVGKAPSSRARVGRRATIGPAALAGQPAPAPPAPTRSASTASSAGGSSSNMGLSSSFQAQTHRWSLFGTDGSGQSNLHLNYNEPAQWGTQSQASQPQPQPSGTASASSSLPTAHSFHASMAHLNLQTPSVSSGGNQANTAAVKGESPGQSFNPFLFPTYAQGQGASAMASVPETEQPHRGSVLSREMSGRSSDTSETSEAKTASAKASRSKVASRASREKLTKDSKAEAPKVDKTVSPEENQQGEEDDDDDAGDDDDDVPSAGTGAKSEAEAKRLAEKRRKRRESHNAVERRRRDNINEKITELATLLPEAMLLDAIATSTQGGNSGTFAPALAAKAALAAAAAAAAKGEAVTGGPDGQTSLPKSSTEAYAAALAPVHANSAALAAAQAKPNKGIILRKSVEYIRHLQQFLDMQMGRIGFLEAELARSHQALAASGMQAPPTTDPQQGLGMMHAFFDQAGNAPGIGGSMFPDAMGQQQPQPQQQQQQQQQHHHQQAVSQDFSAMNLLSLGMPMDTQPSQTQSNAQRPMRMQPNSLAMPHSNSGSHEASAGTPALAAWLEGFDQRTGLPRRSSVDPIEEEEHESGEEDKELSSRGRSSRLAHDTHEEHWRGRSRHKVGRGRVQEGSWPELQPSEAQSPMQLVNSEEHHTTASFSDLGDMKLDL
ncbi:hypothetical protein L1887_57557 [Cichorium endivia]|nr:hypothetical protein L1887_57557 [Cichorium endivia]